MLIPYSLRVFHIPVNELKIVDYFVFILVYMTDRFTHSTSFFTPLLKQRRNLLSLHGIFTGKLLNT